MVYSTVFVFGSLHQFSANKNILGVDSTSQISIHQVAAFNVKNHSVEAAVEIVGKDGHSKTASSLLQPKHGKTPHWNG